MRSILLALILTGALVAPGEGQTPPTFASRSDLVVLSATAVDSRGRPVTDLTLPEVRVFEDGRLQPIVHFASEGIAARVLLLVDGSGSMSNELKTTSARMAAIQVLNALSVDDQVALARFDSEYRPVVGWTSDKRRIESAFADFVTFGSTALHDALDRGARELAAQGQGRRAIVVITDGIDTASVATPDSVIARSRALDVPIYALTVVSPLDDPRSKTYAGKGAAVATETASALLDRYASLSGGAAFVVSNFAALKQAADRIAGEIRHQYRLAYDPPAGPPGFRSVEVRATRKGTRIRTRSGYIPQS